MDSDDSIAVADGGWYESKLTPVSSSVQLVAKIMEASSDLGEVRWMDSLKTLAHMLTQQHSESAEEDAEGAPRALLPPLAAACAKASAAVYLSSRRSFKSALAPLFAAEEVAFMQLYVKDFRPAHALLVSRRYRCIFLVIKGTSSLGDLLADLAGRSQSFFGGGCHTGMAACVDALMQRDYGETVLSALRKSGVLPPTSHSPQPRVAAQITLAAPTTPAAVPSLGDGKETDEDAGANVKSAPESKGGASSTPFAFSGKSVAAALSGWASKRGSAATKSEAPGEEAATPAVVAAGSGTESPLESRSAGTAVAAGAAPPAAESAAKSPAASKGAAPASIRSPTAAAAAAAAAAPPADPMFKSGLASVLWELLRVNPGYSVVLTGHSLGAGIAAILAVTLRACLYYRFVAEGQRLPWETTSTSTHTATGNNENSGAATVRAAMSPACAPASPALQPASAISRSPAASSSFQLLSAAAVAASPATPLAAAPAVSTAAGASPAASAASAATLRVSSLAPAVAACLCPISLNAVGIATPPSLCPQMGALTSLTAEEAAMLAADLAPAASAASAAAIARIRAVQASWDAVPQAANESTLAEPTASASRAAPSLPRAVDAANAVCAASSAAGAAPFSSGDEPALASLTVVSGAAADSSSGGSGTLLRRYEGTLRPVPTVLVAASMRRWPLVSSIVMHHDVVPRLTIASARALHAEITEPSRVARASAELAVWMRQGVDDRRQRMWQALPTPLTTRVEGAATSVSSGWKALAQSTGAALKDAAAALDTMVGRARFGASGAVVREDDLAALYALLPAATATAAAQGGSEAPVPSRLMASESKEGKEGKEPEDAVAVTGSKAGAPGGNMAKTASAVAAASAASSASAGSGARGAAAPSTTESEAKAKAEQDRVNTVEPQSFWARLMAMRPGASPAQRLTRFNSPSVGDSLAGAGEAKTGDDDDTDEDDDDDDDGLAVAASAGAASGSASASQSAPTAVGLATAHSGGSGARRKRSRSALQVNISPLASASDAAMLAAAAQATMNPTAPISATGQTLPTISAGAGAGAGAAAVTSGKSKSTAVVAGGAEAVVPAAAPPPSPAEVALMRRLRLLIERCPINATEPSQQLVCPGLVYHMTRLSSKEAAGASVSIAAAATTSGGAPRTGSVAAADAAAGPMNSDAADPLAGAASPKAAASLHCGMAIVAPPSALTQPTPADAAAAASAAAGGASSTAGAASGSGVASGEPAAAATAALIADSVEADVAAGRFRVHLVPPRRLAAIRVATNMISDHSKEQYAAAAEALSLRTGVLNAEELASASADYAARCKAEEEARAVKAGETRRKFMVPAAAGAAVGVAAAGVGAVVAAPVLATVAAASLAAAGTVAAASAVAIHYEKARKRDASPAPTGTAASAKSPASALHAGPGVADSSGAAEATSAATASTAAVGSADNLKQKPTATDAVLSCTVASDSNLKPVSGTQAVPSPAEPTASGSFAAPAAAATPATPAVSAAGSAGLASSSSSRSLGSWTPTVGMGLGGRLLQGVTGLFGRGAQTGSGSASGGASTAAPATASMQASGSVAASSGSSTSSSTAASSASGGK